MAPEPAKPGQVERCDYSYEKEGRANLFIAYEPLAGKRSLKVTEQRTRKDWALFMQEVLEVHYPTASKVVVVMDNLNTHTPASFYEVFPPEQAKALAGRLEIHYTPKHASWLNIAEIELSVLARQGLAHNIATIEDLCQQIQSWQDHRNQRVGTVNWQFRTADARIKLKRLYPVQQPPYPPQQSQQYQPPMPPPKKKSRKRLWLILAAVVLVLAVIAGVASQGQSQQSTSTTQTTQQAQPTQKSTSQSIHYPPKTVADLHGLAAKGDASAIHEFHSESVGAVGACPQPKREVTVGPSLTGQQLAGDLLAYFYAQQLDSPCGSVVFAYHNQGEAGDVYTAGRILVDVTDSSGQVNLDPNATNLKHTLTLDIGGDLSSPQEYVVTY